ncbi:hypothetical protein FDE94_09315 [Clostridium botulinum]|nr:hypothetical protein [Clostridium botulinum]
MNKGIRICLSCSNTNCKNYYEHMCLKEWRENQVMFLNENGQCEHFEKGVNDTYNIEVKIDE